MSCRTVKTVPINKSECDSLNFDLEAGMINAVSPLLSQMEIKEWFPCFNRYTQEGASIDCGGGVFFENNGFFYNTYMDYVEISNAYKGKVTKNIINLDRATINSSFEDSLYIDKVEMYPSIDFFVKPYGCLVIQYKDTKVLRVASHFNDCSMVIICPD